MEINFGTENQKALNNFKKVYIARPANFKLLGPINNTGNSAEENALNLRGDRDFVTWAKSSDGWPSENQDPFVYIHKIKNKDVKKLKISLLIEQLFDTVSEGNDANGGLGTNKATNLEINKNIEKHLTAATSISTTSTNSVTSDLSTNGARASFNLDIDILDKSAIKKETYYKMKYIMNSLDKNWAIKKRENVFYLKNLDNSTKDIITEDYLNKRVIQKIYSEAIVKTTSSDDINKEIKKQATHMAPESVTNMGTTMGTKKKEDIISLKDGILALKELMNKETMDMNKELRQEIYIMIFLMNALESGWSIRKKDNKFVFRKRHNHRKEVYSDNYLVNFLKNNLKNIVF
jgi:hypothetical protein